MKRILAIGASSSRKSINKELALYIASQIKNAEVILLDLNDYEMPIYSIDRENENGIHKLAYAFKQEIKKADGIVISFAEHNGSYSAAFKNIFDWVSRISNDVWEGKPMFLSATAPGGHGGKTVLEMAFNRFSRRNKNTIVTFSLPEFKNNFSKEDGILNIEYLSMFKEDLLKFEEALLKTNALEISK